MEEKYDIIIVGAGPAGLSAAITARARNKKVLVISNPVSSNPLAASKQVDNYPGMPDATGLEILESMAAHAAKLGAEFLQARVISILPFPLQDEAGKSQMNFSVTTSSDFVDGRSVIIACGAASGGKTIEGESEYLGRGVSYCATCDGMFFREGTVLVLGMNSEAVKEANFLAEIGAEVHFVSKKAAEGLDSRITQHVGKLLAIEGGEEGVTQVRLAESAEGSKTQETTLKVDGVFLLRPGVAPATMLATLDLENNYIKVDSSMCTSSEGVFAAGDCTGKPLQIAKAVGEGQVAVLSAVEYLSN